MIETHIDDLELDLTHYMNIILRRRWVVASTWLTVLLAALVYAFTTPPVFEASTLLIIEKERGSSAVTADGTMVESSNEDYYQTQYRLLKSESLLQQVYDKLRLDTMEDFAAPRGPQKLYKAVTIAPVLRSRLVYIRARSHDPSLAMQIANTLSQFFVEQNLSNQLFISKEVLSALQLNGSEAGAERTYEALPAVVNNQLIQQLKAEYAKLQSQHADMSSRYTSRHPAMVALKSNMAALDRQITVETQKIVQSLKTELSGQLKGNNIRVVDPALRPENPVKPRKLLALLTGLLSGLLCGIAAAFLVEVLDQSVHSQEDVEQKLRLPFLGMIPLSHHAAPVVYQALLSKELSLTSEAIRNLRTMVDFAGVSQKSRVVLVASTVQSEGKSYVSSNLAVAFAQMGESVLLISGDLRRPSIHRIFSVGNEAGVSDFLAKGKDVGELASLVRETDVPRLRILPCGPRPPNPSELLNTPRVGALIDWAKENHDRVIVDCPPIFPIHDTLLWGRHVNVAIFIVRYGSTRAPLVSKACEKLAGRGIKVLGAVVNAVRPGGLTYSSYGYYYQQYYHSYQNDEDAVKEDA